MPLPSSVYAAALALLTGAVAPAAAPSRPLPTVPRRPSAPLLRLMPPARSGTPDMVHMPKSSLVSGLRSLGGQAFLTGPDGAIVLGPIHGVVLPCDVTAIPLSAGKPRDRR